MDVGASNGSPLTLQCGTAHRPAESEQHNIRCRTAADVGGAKLGNTLAIEGQ